MNRGKVFGIINDERDYQDAQRESGGVHPHHGRFQKQIHTVGEELILMKVYLDKAIAKYANNFGDAPALHGIRKVAALAIRCMENHGALPREEPLLLPVSSKDKVETPDKEEEKEEDEDEVPF